MKGSSSPRSTRQKASNGGRSSSYGAPKGRFPNPKAVEEGGTEEERRLFYVAATRAMDQLYLCYPLMVFDRQIGSVILRPSRFIAELESPTTKNGR